MWGLIALTVSGAAPLKNKAERPRGAAARQAGRQAAGRWRLVPPQRGVPPVLSAQAAILIDADTGQWLWERNARRPMYPASLTKMMTALLAIESGSLDRLCCASARAAQTKESGIGLRVGEKLTLEQALLASLLKSANDASVMIAENVAGSVPAFVQRMNERAQAMGLSGTHFANPHGLHDPQHVSTAADLAEIAREAMRHEEFARLVALREATIPGPPGGTERRLINRNRLLLRWQKCDGIKTGYTRQAGRCLAASASEGGWRLICVVLHCRDAWSDAQTLLCWGFLNYERRPVARVRDIYEVPVRHGARRYVLARPVADLYIVTRKGASEDPTVIHEGESEAPVVVGQVVGRLRTGTGASVDLQAIEAVPLSFWARLRHMSLVRTGTMLAVLWAAGVLLHGASAKAARTRRNRLAARRRKADPRGARHDRWTAGAPGKQG